MQKIVKKILKLFITNPKKLFSRQEIEDKIEGIGRRTIIRTLSLLEKERRIETVGQSSATRYIFCEAYHEDFEEKLYLYQNQICIGYLGFDYEKYYFAYDSAYLLSSKYLAIFQMPISTQTYVQYQCFVDFEELLPEGVDRKILIEKTGNATEFFLLANNNYSANDLIFSKKQLSFSKPIKTESYLLHKEKILGKNRFPNVYDYVVELEEKSLFPHEYMNEEDIKNIRTISLSGYQHKLQVTLENATIKVAKEEDEVEYFIKPYHPQKADPQSPYYFPHIAINEHLYMSFAKNELGFDVPHSGLFKRDGDKEYHYIIKYFDRYKGYKFQRKEFASYLGLQSHNKYNTSSEKLFVMASKVLFREEDRLRMLEYH